MEIEKGNPKHLWCWSHGQQCKAEQCVAYRPIQQVEVRRKDVSGLSPTQRMDLVDLNERDGWEHVTAIGMPTLAFRRYVETDKGHCGALPDGDR